MNEEKKLLPLGSVVYLTEGTTKLVVIAREPVFPNAEGQDVYADYIGVMYPEGFQPENVLFFNDEDVDQVLHTGFSDEEEERYMKVYKEWESELQVPKMKPEN